MSDRAIVTLLRPHDIGVLARYVGDTGATILTPNNYCGAEGRKAIEQAGGKVLVLEEILAASDMSDLRRAARSKAESIAKAVRSGALAREVAKWGADLPEADLRAGTALLEQAPLAAYLERMLTWIEALERARNQYRIELTLLGDEWTEFGRMFLHWSRQNGIPVLHLTHGIGLSRYYTVHSTLEADKYAVFGERGGESLRDAGVAAEQIVAVGNPVWDAYPGLLSSGAEVRRGLCARHGLDAAKPIVVFGTTWNAHLSAFDQRSYVRDLDLMMQAFSRLAELGCPDAQLVIKDRVAHGDEARLVKEATARAKLPSVLHTMEDARPWVVAADVLVSVDSNLSVECVLAGTPSINLIDETGLVLGPSFSADSGIVEILPARLAETLAMLLTDKEQRRLLGELMKAKAPSFNLAMDGNAGSRLAELMKSMALGGAGAVAGGNAKYIWETLLEVDEADATQYHNWPRSELVDLAPRTPRRVLDIGCAAGKTGEYIKHKFPQAKVYGVEVNRTAAALAAKRLDSVFAGKFEDFDFAAHGIEPGSLDTVIVADVLEHIYDPWGVMVRLRPYLTADAQVLASIPNTRNLALMNGLAEGDWRYEPWGLLDVTHIRFFTLKAIRRYFHETGYRVARVHHNLDGRLTNLYQANRDKPLVNVDFDKFTLKNVTQEELVELCTLQFFVVAEPGAQAEAAFEAEEQERLAVNDGRTAYDLWRAARSLTKAQGDLYEQRMAAWPSRPRFHLGVVANPADIERIGGSIQSLASQYYHDLSLTLISPAPPPPDWGDSERLAWRQAPENMLLEAANSALLESGADWLGLIDAGDRVASHSFLALAEAVVAHPEWRFVYTDEDVFDAGGRFDAPRFKPDFNLDLLRGSAYTGGLALTSRALFEQLGGFLPSMKGAEEYDLVLRAYEAAGARAIGHLPDVLYHRPHDGGRWRLPMVDLIDAGKRALEAHLARGGVAGTVENGLFPASYRVRYAHASTPRVSILVAVRDRLDAVQRCIESVLSTTRYPDYEVLIIDNDSITSDARAYLAGLKAMGEERIRIHAHAAAASQPLLHNLMAGEARGAYLLFLDFDAAVLQEDWLDSMMAHALRPEVGMVAPRLLRADGSVEQSGLVLGMDRAVDSPFRGEAMDFPGYEGRAHLEQDFSALGGGCLLVRKSLFVELGGFDVENFPAQFAEADFSRRVAEQGLLAVWTPFVSILCEGGAARHGWRDAPIDEDAVRLACEAATDQLYRRWLPQLARDPAYNPNLSLEAGKYFHVETRSTITWDPLPWRPLPRVLAQPADIQGCGEYRIVSPMRALTEAGRVQGWADFHIFTAPEMERLDLDAIILQRQTTPDQIRAIARHKKFSRALRVYELDDLLIRLPLKSIHNAHIPKDIAKKLRQAIALCDRFVVSTEPLREAYRDYHADIRVVPNFIERARWGGLKPLRNQSAKPRVGWAGGVGHSGDLEMIASVVKTLADRVDWVFMGMCPDDMRPWIREFHPGVPVEQFPSKLASLNLDLALAPLECNPFNEAKSHLRLLEYGVLGYPVICSDIYPYRGDFPVTRVRNRHKEWVDAILALVADADQRARSGDSLREHVNQHWMLEDNVDVWLQAWLP